MIEFVTALAAAAAAPIQVDVISLDERRTQSPDLQTYERLRVRVANAGGAPATFRLCPEDLRSENIGLRDGRSSSAVRAFAASVAPRRSWRAGCQNVPLEPGQSRVVTYFLRGENRDIRTQRRELRLVTNAGAFTFRLPSRVRAT